MCVLELFIRPGCKREKWNACFFVFWGVLSDGVEISTGNLEPLKSSFCFSEMNRHHYALYVHNCRLVFLLRKDFDQADTFRPAEFHWKPDQVWRSQRVCALLSRVQGWLVSPGMVAVGRHLTVLVTCWFGGKSTLGNTQHLKVGMATAALKTSRRWGGPHFPARTRTR